MALLKLKNLTTWQWTMDYRGTNWGSGLGTIHVVTVGKLWVKGVASRCLQLPRGVAGRGEVGEPTRPSGAHETWTLKMTRRWDRGHSFRPSHGGEREIFVGLDEMRCALLEYP